MVFFPGGSRQAETSLYAELDKLSAAWEALDRQVKNKVFDLTAMEERLQKMGHDVRYFAFTRPTFHKFELTFGWPISEGNRRTNSTLPCGIKKPSRMNARTSLGT
jgi:hypothetical protein